MTPDEATQLVLKEIGEKNVALVDGSIKFLTQVARRLPDDYAIVLVDSQVGGRIFLVASPDPIFAWSALRHVVSEITGSEKMLEEIRQDLEEDFGLSLATN